MKTESMLDVSQPMIVGIQISDDRRTVWVNVDGKCCFRASRIKNLILEVDGIKLQSPKGGIWPDNANTAE